MQTLKALVDVVLAVAVQSLMLAQVSFGYWRLRRRAVLEPSVATLDKRLRRRPLPAEAVVSVVIPAYREVGTIEATLRRKRSSRRASAGCAMCAGGRAP